MDRVISSIRKDCQRQHEADEHFTMALEALEELKWDEAQNLAQVVLDTSTNIEQRIAAIFILNLAVERNELNTSGWLAIAYQYE